MTGEVNVDFADVRTVMANRGPALMGTGSGRGENRAMEAAQEAISSPLLDSISIQGAAGVLINITGGADLAIDEVTTISSIIQEAAGDEAEIIFGAVHDPELQDQVRVTVIATGFGRPHIPHIQRGPAIPRAGGARRAPDVPMRLTGTRVVRPVTPQPPKTPPPANDPQRALDLQIPTFIRRQMD